MREHLESDDRIDVVFYNSGTDLVELRDLNWSHQTKGLCDFGTVKPFFVGETGAGTARGATDRGPGKYMKTRTNWKN